LTTLDHLILAVDDLEASVWFYTEIAGFAHEGTEGPFTVIRVGPSTTLQLSPWGTGGHQQHLAFALSPVDFDAAFRRVQAAGIAFGDSYHDAGNMRGPGNENGAQGPGAAVYLLDPSKHLIELRHY
jgi:catechol 2,3-dioxygenase-like lactoylglutathione lyase family enzyme